MKGKQNMIKLNLSYLTADSARTYNFYLLPKELIDNPAFDEIDYGAKILYSLMLNRASLSAVHSADFTDKNGNLYIIYTVEQVMENMRCATQTAVKMLKQLDDIGLIEKHRQGQGKPSIIYVKDFSTIEFLNSKKCNSRTPKNRSQELQKVECSNPNQNQNQNLSENDIYHSEKVQNGNAPASPPDNADKIDINELKRKYPQQANEIQEIYELITEILHSTRTAFRIAKDDMPAPVVKSAFLRLNNQHMEYILKSLSKNTTKVKNVKSYLLTTIFNAVKTLSNNFNLDAQNFFYEKFDIYQ